MQRVDKFLWYARFFKSRTLASTAVQDGRVRVNGQRCEKASTIVRPGDVLTFAAGGTVRVIHILNCGTRRGPASEAQSLYRDATPPREKTEAEPPSPALRPRGSGRPTKKDQRAIAALKSPFE